MTPNQGLFYVLLWIFCKCLVNIKNIWDTDFLSSLSRPRYINKYPNKMVTTPIHGTVGRGFGIR